MAMMGSKEEELNWVKSDASHVFSYHIWIWSNDCLHSYTADYGRLPICVSQRGIADPLARLRKFNLANEKRLYRNRLSSVNQWRVHAIWFPNVHGSDGVNIKFQVSNIVISPS